MITPVCLKGCGIWRCIRTFKVKVTDKGPDGKNSSRSICERVIDHSLGTMNLNANYTFDLETWNLQGQGHRQRSWREQLIGLSTSDVWKSYWPWSSYNEVKRQLQHLTLKLGTFKVKATDKGHDGKNSSRSIYIWGMYNEVKCQLHIWPWNLEPLRSTSQTKVTMERTHQGIFTSEVLKELLTMV